MKRILLQCFGSGQVYDHFKPLQVFQDHNRNIKFGEHPEYSRDTQAIKFSVTRTGPKCLERQVREAVQLANMDPDRIINTHMEFIAPAIQRMTHTNLLDDGRNRGAGQN